MQKTIIRLWVLVIELWLMTQTVHSDEFLMGGPARSNPADFLMGGDLAAVEAKRPLNFYGPSWCPHCPTALASVKKELGEEFEITVHKDYDAYPAWVIAQGQKTGWGYPMVNWTDKSDAGKIMVWSGVDEFRKQDGSPKKNAAAAPTPYSEVVRVLALLPKPEIGFVDFGSGDGRWCLAAAERWPDVRITGVEIDPARASAARERVKASGFEDRITIITGDVLTSVVEADIGVAYLYADVLAQLRPRLENLRAFASYQHQPPGLPVVQNGDSWLYVRGTQAVQQPRSAAVWQGQYYSQPVCNSPGCKMCNSIRSDLGIQPPSGSVWWSLLDRKR